MQREKTLKDVAVLAGVSPITVSRVLNGNYHVSEDTTRKVLDAVASLHYKPNAIARSLRNSRTHTIGVLIPDISNPYFMRLIRAFETYAQSQGYSILLASSDDSPERENNMIDILAMRVDGIVVAPSQMTISKSLRRYVDRGLPAVLIDRSTSDINLPTVVEENENSSYELIKHLIALGHRDIAMINSGAPISTVVERQRGYERAMEECEIPLNEAFQLRGHFDEQTGYTFGKRLLTRTAMRPTAIFCANNFITVGVMIAIRELGLTIPHDVSIVSFGDLLLPELITPRITAVIQNPESIGELAGRTLINNLQSEQDSHADLFVLPTHIRLGESVRPL